MQMKTLFEDVRVRRITAALCLAVAIGLLASAATEVFAATRGSEFNDVYDLVKAWATGGLGKTISISFLLVGLAIGILRGSVVSAVSCLAACVALLLGPAIIDSLFGATTGG